MVNFLQWKLHQKSLQGLNINIHGGPQVAEYNQDTLIIQQND